ncbi:MAG: anti-sigma F factor antagonist, partial [Treponema sp.]|nr:anti-sigma F factor antagonist [Treponema sp.]
FTIKNNMADAIASFNKSSDSSDHLSVFPKAVSCPVCSRKLKATKSGRFRCSDCKSIIAIDQTGHVFLG